MLNSNPALIREFLKGHILQEWQLGFLNNAFLDMHIEKMILPLAQQVFERPLKKTDFKGCHLQEGEGFLPLQYKLQKKAFVVEICLKHKRPWPLYINTLMEFKNPGLPISDLQLTKQEIEEVKFSSKSYLLNPGDAIFYNGHNYPHWRDAIETGNFCDLVIYHFETRV